MSTLGPATGQQARASGRGQCLVDGPPTLQTRSERRWINPASPGPICDGPRVAIEGDRVRTAAILRLLSPSRPAYIAGCVGTVIVDAVQAVVRTWTRPDVVEKCLRGVAPLRANGDSAPAVVRICAGCHVMAAIVHTDPDVVAAGGPQTMLGDDLLLAASAGLRISDQQAVLEHGPLRSARTAAKPFGGRGLASPDSFGLGKYCPSPERLSRGRWYAPLSHCRASFIGACKGQGRVGVSAPPGPSIVAQDAP